MYQLTKKFLFALDPETSHELSMDMLGSGERLGLLNLLSRPRVQDPINLWGLNFPNRVGLAAGLDKNGDYVNGLGKLGFGFIEIGTVTPLAQAGNPKPRLFRLEPAEAIINRMGFNNKGVDHLVQQVKKRRFDGVLGINIGKNKLTPEENALDDYTNCMRKVYAHADYITINISSPNTPGLRDLQFGDALKKLLAGIKITQDSLAQEHQRKVPVLVKIAPDMEADELRDVANTLREEGIDGVIATNTTVSRTEVSDLEHGNEAGGLSGKPLMQASTHVIQLLHAELGAQLPIIGVGGIFTAEDAQQKIAAGASLVQVYSGFIYRGPGIVREIAKALAAR